MRSCVTTHRCADDAFYADSDYLEFENEREYDEDDDEYDEEDQD